MGETQSTSPNFSVDFLDIERLDFIDQFLLESRRAGATPALIERYFPGISDKQASDILEVFADGIEASERTNRISEILLVREEPSHKIASQVREASEPIKAHPIVRQMKSIRIAVATVVGTIGAGLSYFALKDNLTSLSWDRLVDAGYSPDSIQVGTMTISAILAALFTGYLVRTRDKIADESARRGLDFLKAHRETFRRKPFAAAFFFLAVLFGDVPNAVYVAQFYLGDEDVARQVEHSGDEIKKALVFLEDNYTEAAETREEVMGKGIQNVAQVEIDGTGPTKTPGAGPVYKALVSLETGGTTWPNNTPFQVALKKVLSHYDVEDTGLPNQFKTEFVLKMKALVEGVNIQLSQSLEKIEKMVKNGERSYGVISAEYTKIDELLTTLQGDIQHEFEIAAEKSGENVKGAAKAIYDTAKELGGYPNFVPVVGGLEIPMPRIEPLSIEVPETFRAKNTVELLTNAWAKDIVEGSLVTIISILALLTLLIQPTYVRFISVALNGTNKDKQREYIMNAIRTYEKLLDNFVEALARNINKSSFVQSSCGVDIPSSYIAEKLKSYLKEGVFQKLRTDGFESLSIGDVLNTFKRLEGFLSDPEEIGSFVISLFPQGVHPSKCELNTTAIIKHMDEMMGISRHKVAILALMDFSSASFQNASVALRRVEKILEDIRKLPSAEGCSSALDSETSSKLVETVTSLEQFLLRIKEILELQISKQQQVSSRKKVDILDKLVLHRRINKAMQNTPEYNELSPSYGERDNWTISVSGPLNRWYEEMFGSLRQVEDSLRAEVLSDDQITEQLWRYTREAKNLEVTKERLSTFEDLDVSGQVCWLGNQQRLVFMGRNIEGVESSLEKRVRDIFQTTSEDGDMSENLFVTLKRFNTELSGMEQSCAQQEDLSREITAQQRRVETLVTNLENQLMEVGVEAVRDLATARRNVIIFQGLRTNENAGFLTEALGALEEREKLLVAREEIEGDFAEILVSDDLSPSDRFLHILQTREQRIRLTSLQLVAPEFQENKALFADITALLDSVQPLKTELETYSESAIQDSQTLEACERFRDQIVAMNTAEMRELIEDYLTGVLEYLSQRMRFFQARKAA